ncbi:alpha/beta fold hydrolase [Alkalicoccobacillus plakortidis]|uniref:Alpha/beta fold hydrolase n=1 Tax=Alkalicoccobacillus plakortidis TaxID=444060 RepID=A0ABT0XLS0_9BACI|nr:alpha/beta fold hydrolase [Alkalicoccobacillus plakortidis]MCM2676854.1 alpha/beta fold hydrolase [Alkalicoccobacillus plakortidis]
MVISRSILVLPLHSYIDDDLSIKISGCNPYVKIRIESKMLDQKENVFKAQCDVQADSEGKLSLSQTEVDRLFWSAEKENTRHGDYFYKSDASELEMDLVFEVDDQVQETVQVRRYFYTEDIKREEVKEQGVVGTLFESDAGDNQPAVLLLGGSDGEIQEHAAALLASKGYTVFALAYFGQEGVPKDLEKIPLEYFYDAVQWLKTRANKDKVSIIGYSRGAEIALLVASTYDDEFDAVVAGAPGAYVTSGLKNTMYAPIPSWTLDGEELPYLKFKYRPAQMFSMVGGMITRNPVSFLSIWENSLKSPEEIDPSRIQVEKIKAPVMLIAGGQDQVWPAERFATQIEERVNVPIRCLNYEEAGHFLAFPYALPGMPANVNMHVGAGMIMDFGGTKSANAAAAKASWKELLNFLRENAR